MKPCKIILDGTGKFPEVGGHAFSCGRVHAISALPADVESEEPAALIVIETDKKEFVVGEVPMKTFLAAAAAFATNIVATQNNHLCRTFCKKKDYCSRLLDYCDFEPIQK